MQRARSFRGYFIPCASALALGVLCLGAESPPLTAADAGRGPSAAVDPGASCSVVHKHPLFVGFAEGMSLDGFEAATLASRDIWRGVKAWLCEVRGEASASVPHTRSLHGALARQHGLRVETIQFDHPSLSRAHLELLDLASGTHAPSGWRIHMQRADEGWQVTRADDQRFDAASDAPAPSTTL